MSVNHSLLLANLSTIFSISTSLCHSNILQRLCVYHSQDPERHVHGTAVDLLAKFDTF